jgi:HD-GYP domain-containing protein (c-di-GMP phosphodiesterase class II)
LIARHAQEARATVDSAGKVAAQSDQGQRAQRRQLPPCEVLKKIPISKLRLGMHLHALEGPWIEHPFWKTRFVVTDASDLRRLRDSGLLECWIDDELGLAPTADDRADKASPRRAAPAERPTAGPAVAAPATPASRDMAAELRQAAVVCQRGRKAVLSMFNEARMGRALDAEGCLPLVDDISASVLRNPGALVSLARLKTADDYSYMHSVAVCALMVALARQLDLDADTCRRAGLAGLLHDMGKAVMPPEVLNKPGRLTDAEFAVMRTHPERGHALLLEGRGVGPEALDVCLHHHERFDGTGYPHGLAGDTNSLLARMAAVCDVYDAITSNRPYKAGWDPAESIARMASWKGHFDEALFAAFVRSLGIYPTGSLVRLQSGRLAVVVEQNADALVSPVVKVFFSVPSQLPLPPRRLDLSRTTCSDRIVGRESPKAWGFDDLEQHWLDPDIRKRAASV